jgi:hypothetical protein
MMPDAKAPTERSFGFSVGGASLVFAALLAWRAHPRGAVVAAAIGAVLVLGALVAPSALRVPNRLWWRFASLLGWFNSRVLLTAMFFLVLTPAGVLMRLFGRSPLRAASRDSNWVSVDARRRDAKHFDHLY